MFNLMPWKKQAENSRRELMDYENRFPTTPFRREFEALMDRYLGPWRGSTEGDPSFDRLWGLDLDETDKEVTVRVEAPGFEANDFDLQVQNNRLVVKAEKKHEEDGKHGTSYRYGSFRRIVSLPPGLDAEHVDASYRNGVLEVHLPKTEQVQGKRIAVKAESHTW